MIAAKDLQLVQETAQQFHHRGDEERARAIESVLAVAVAALAGRSAAPRREYLTTGQAASVLGVSPQTIRRWVTSGKLEGICQVGRTLVRRDVILAHLETLKEPTPEHATRPAEAVRAEHEWYDFLLSGLPADKVARQEALHERMEDGYLLTPAERAEMVMLEREIAAAAARRLQAWLRRPVAAPS